MYEIKKNMSINEFKRWKESWLLRIPKCKNFDCIHELDTCCIKRLCACGSIYSTYSSQKEPRECDDVGCEDCDLKYECERFKDRQKISEILDKRKETSVILY